MTDRLQLILSSAIGKLTICFENFSLEYAQLYKMQGFNYQKTRVKRMW